MKLITHGGACWSLFKILIKTKKLIIYKCQYLAAISPDEKAVRGSLFSMIISQNSFLGFQILIILPEICFLLLFSLNLSFTYACMSIPLCSVSLFQNIFFFSTYLKVSRTSLRPTSIKLLVSINLIFLINSYSIQSDQITQLYNYSG